MDDISGKAKKTHKPPTSTEETVKGQSPDESFDKQEGEASAGPSSEESAPVIRETKRTQTPAEARTTRTVKAPEPVGKVGTTGKGMAGILRFARSRKPR